MAKEGEREQWNTIKKKKNSKKQECHNRYLVQKAINHDTNRNEESNLSTSLRCIEKGTQKEAKWHNTKIE